MTSSIPDSCEPAVGRHIRVVGAVISRDRKILAAQRSADMSLPGKWEFPGGKIESGEDPRHALKKRELAEELDCHVEVGDHVETTSHDYDFGTVELSTYACTLLGGEPRALEHAELRWVDSIDLSQLDWAPADIPAVEGVMKRRGA